MTHISAEFSQGFPLDTDSLPTSWNLATLSEIADEVNSGFPTGKHSQDSDGIPHLRPMNIDRFGKIDLNIVKYVISNEGKTLQENDILFNNTNSPELIGKTALISEKESGFAFSNHMTRIKINQEIKEPRLFTYYLNFLWEFGYLKQRCTNHVNQASISTKILAETVPFIVPPLNEQTRIVAKLEELFSDLDAGVNELKTAQAKLKQYRQSLLKAAVEGELSREWRESRPANDANETGAQLLDRILLERRKRWEEKQLAKFAEQGKQPPKDWQKKYPEPVKPDTTDLPNLPEGWVWASCEQVCDFITKGTTPPKNMFLDDEIRNVPFLRVTNLTNQGKLNLADKVFVSEKTHNNFLSRSKVFPNDILMNIVGPPLGQVIIVPKDYPEWNINQAIVIYRPLEGLSSVFMCHYLLSNPAQSWLLKRSKTTAGQTNLTLEVCRQLPVPISPKLEQQRIVNLLEESLLNFDKQEQTIKHVLSQSAAQRKNILRAAFAGELVPQDPNDEPASVLLKRIQAERQAQISASKTSPPKTRKAASKQQAQLPLEG